MIQKKKEVNRDHMFNTSASPVTCEPSRGAHHDHRNSKLHSNSIFFATPLDMKNQCVRDYPFESPSTHERIFIKGQNFTCLFAI
jgi:hypothetical protein